MHPLWICAVHILKERYLNFAPSGNSNFKHGQLGTVDHRPTHHTRSAL